MQKNNLFKQIYLFYKHLQKTNKNFLLINTKSHYATVELIRQNRTAPIFVDRHDERSPLTAASSHLITANACSVLWFLSVLCVNALLEFVEERSGVGNRLKGSEMEGVGRSLLTRKNFEFCW